MSGNIHITSFDSLRRLDTALGVFAEDVIDRIQSIGQLAERRFAEIESCCEALETELQYLQSEYDSADEDDDTGYLAYKIQETEEKLRRAQSLQRRAEEAIENFARRARRVDAIANERVGEAREFLRRKFRELQEYAAVNLSGGESNFNDVSGTIASAFDAALNSQASLNLSESSIEELEKIPLPKGFEWVRLDEISQEALDDLPDESQFEKVSYAEMKEGLKKFESEILPVLRSKPANSNAEYFEELDMKNGRDEAGGTKKIFNVFFGRQFPEYIKVDRYGKGNGLDSITNGRHRLKVARDLGWKVIPAEVSEVNQSKL